LMKERLTLLHIADCIPSLSVPNINVPVWHWHGKITMNVLLCVPALLLTNEYEAHSIY
jgi:hypothetical protein